MNMSGVGTILDSTRYSSLNVQEQMAQQEAGEEYAEQAATVQEASESATGDQAGSYDASTCQNDSISAMAQSTSSLLEALESSDDDSSSNQSLINKANSGQQLTNSELSRLKEVDPALYSSVVKAAQARVDLRSEMSRNPSQAVRAVQAALTQYNSEDQSITRQALNDEYREISSKYDQADFGRQWAW